VVPRSGGTITVVVLFCGAGGTITVVLFCGAGGLLLLMHPDMAASTTSEANIIFMLNPLVPEQISCATSMMVSVMHWIRPAPGPGVGDLLQWADYAVFTVGDALCVSLTMNTR
jgi:hypothetical protein